MPLILILDDQVTNRKIFERLAESIADDVVVQVFGDPHEALNWLATNEPPDLVVTDYKMPHLDGAEFIQRFRARPEHAEIPVIVITVHEERRFRLKALEAGATDFLQSPVDHHEFRTRARNLLKLRRQQLILENRAQILASELAQSERSRVAALRDSTERLGQVIDTVPAMVCACDRDGNILFVNACHTTFAGADPAAVVGAGVDRLLGEEQGARHRALDRKVFETEQALPSFEQELIGAAGTPHVFLTTKAPLRDGDDLVVAVLTSSLDITERKRAEAHLLHMAHHDPLTGLPNRSALYDRLRREIARSRRGDRTFALHFVDLDGFKSLNDLLGHAGGDKLLKILAQRLSAMTASTGYVARIGGDEFAVLQTDITRPEDVAALSERIIATICEPIAHAGRRLALGASIGIALHPTDASDANDLLKNADLAMYRAKSEGGNQHCFYVADMASRVRNAALLDAALREALSHHQFQLYYQPQIEVVTGRIVGAEALLRWNHPERGIVAPGEFLARAEENGLIVPINEWVLREAAREAKSWQRRGLPPMRIAVNLSPIQFRRRNVSLQVIQALAETGLEPQWLDLEITESIVMDDDENVTSQLRQLTDLGVGLSIDDFGTGYSSLQYLKRFPIDRLKIDQCFVRNVVQDPSDAAIVRAIISLGHSLELTVVAEGVETRDQIALLTAEGCDELQGYHYGRPMPALQFVELVRAASVGAKSA
jgi:diguanylate cyclase (GGDEF)-like protein/PAS domain S-box-containing protein